MTNDAREASDGPPEETVDNSLTAEDTVVDETDVKPQEPAETAVPVDDDEHWIQMQEEGWEDSPAYDEVLYSEEARVVAAQPKGTVTWAIEGLYDESGRVRKKFFLKANPPLLVVESVGLEPEDVNHVEFVLTRELSGELAKHFDNTHKAYYGITPASERTFSEKLAAIRDWMREHKFATAVMGLIVAFMLVTSIVAYL